MVLHVKPTFYGSNHPKQGSHRFWAYMEKWTVLYGLWKINAIYGQYKTSLDIVPTKPVDKLVVMNIDKPLATPWMHIQVQV
jgi:hypothetical protein